MPGQKTHTRIRALWLHSVQCIYGTVMKSTETMCHTPTLTLHLRRKAMDWRFVSPFLAGVSLIITLFIPASSAQQTRKLLAVTIKIFIRSRTAQIALSSS